MLDLARLQRIHLTEKPLGQRVVAALMWWDYRFPRRTEIVLEGVERIPQDRSVFLAMNHTDRYNYWPFQYAMHRRGLRYTATWVKGKYYNSGLMGRFLDWANNIPLPSRGYVLTRRFRDVAGRVPTDEEYRVLRDLVDEQPVEEERIDPALDQLLGPAGGVRAWADGVVGEFNRMVAEVVRINREAIHEQRLQVLVFPQGTRSRRLIRGHTGMAQMSQHLGAAIVPVGCNGADRLYPGSSPLSKGGRVVYRVGEPLDLDGPQLGPLRVSEDFAPLTTDATLRFGQRFQAITDVVMDRINDLLDPEYQRGEGAGSDVVEGARRFV